MDVILVDKDDNVIGAEDKLKAHEEGLLHRAFSIFIFNSKNETLLQKRAESKYHSPGLWANACCSHPRPGKNIAEEAKKRLDEEMGIACDLTEMFSFTYKGDAGNGLIEHEYDHVFFGRFDDIPTINKEEVSDYQWIALDTLEKDIKKNPEDYSVWLKSCIGNVILKARPFCE
ncbi:MAG: isopentenyl-diphosphate Delta-isomerase [archaeon]